MSIPELSIAEIERQKHPIPRTLPGGPIFSRKQFETMAAGAMLAVGGPAGFSKRRKLNAYVCTTCHFILAAIDRDPGGTPDLIRCPNCPEIKAIGKIKFATKAGFMQSINYRTPPGLTPEMATHEFYRPTYEFYLDIKHIGTVRHIERGGLLLRKIGEVLPIGFENSRL